MIGGLVVIAGLLGWYVDGLVALPLWALTVMALYLFRDPPRTRPALPLGVLSPVDGRVEAVDEIRDPCLDRNAVRIRLCMFGTGTYSVRAPIEGKVMQRWQDKLIANRCEDGDNNDEFDDYGIWIQSDEKDDIVLLIPGGLPFRHPRFYPNTGDRIGQGQRCGFIRFGSRVDLLLPVTSKIAVQAGQRVSGGESVLGNLVHEKLNVASPQTN